MDTLPDILLFISTQVFMLVGLFGLLIPIFPGTLVMWVAALIYGFLDGWSGLGIFLFVVISLLTAASLVMDDIFIGAGARRSGAPWSTVLLSLAAGLVGTLVFPPVGGLFAAPGVMLLLEYRRTQEWSKAWATLRGMAAGWGLAFVARFSLGLLMMGLWWLWAWRG